MTEPVDLDLVKARAAMFANHPERYPGIPPFVMDEYRAMAAELERLRDAPSQASSPAQTAARP